MCRFLLAKSVTAFSPAILLEKFSDMSQKSKALDGDWQGDGWGVSTKNVDGSWKTYTSLSPIWEESNTFTSLQPTTHLVVHARSASFPSQKGILEYNQPFIQGNIAFVFNGLLKGVSFPTPIAGTIGAQKIWTIAKKHLQEMTVSEALSQTIQTLNKHTKTIQALNVGITDGTSIFAYNQYMDFPEYYSLHLHKEKTLSFIVSEPLEGYPSHPIQPKKIITI